MDVLTTVIIATGLAMDSFAVSIAEGCIVSDRRFFYAFRTGLFFGLFQAVMPLIGWLGASRFTRQIQDFDHWIAFGLLAFIGLRMIYESFTLEKNDCKPEVSGIRVILALSVATSIDALAVGISFAVLDVRIIYPVIVIGVITFLFSFAGIFIGNRLGHFFERKIEFLGGAILIGIGVKILVEHLIYQI